MKFSTSTGTFLSGFTPFSTCVIFVLVCACTSTRNKRKCGGLYLEREQLFLRVCVDGGHGFVGFLHDQLHGRALTERELALVGGCEEVLNRRGG